MFRLAGLAILAVSLPASAWFWGPSSFDECVIDESKEFESTVPLGAMYAIRNVCRERFPREVAPAPVDSKACDSRSPGAPDGAKWSGVITSTRFRFMTENQRESARVAFFDQHVAPRAANEKHLVVLQSEWDKQTIPARYVSCK